MLAARTTSRLCTWRGSGSRRPWRPSPPDASIALLAGAPVTGACRAGATPGADRDRDPHPRADRIRVRAAADASVAVGGSPG